MFSFSPFDDWSQEVELGSNWKPFDLVYDLLGGLSRDLPPAFWTMGNPGPSI